MSYNTLIGKTNNYNEEPGESLSSQLVVDLLGANKTIQKLDGENTELKDRITELEKESKGTQVFISTEPISELTFTTDPQTQLNDVLNKVNDNSTQISSIKEQLDNPGIEVDSNENIEFDASGLTLDDLINESHQIPQYQAEWFNKVNKNTQFIVNNVKVNVGGQFVPFHLIFKPTNITTLENMIGGEDNPRVTLIDFECYMTILAVQDKYHLTVGWFLTENASDQWIDFRLEKVDTNTSVSQEVLEAITTEWEV